MKPGSPTMNWDVTDSVLVKPTFFVRLTCCRKCGILKSFITFVDLVHYIELKNVKELLLLTALLGAYLRRYFTVSTNWFTLW